MAKNGKGKKITIIELFDNYYVAVDNYSYELRKKTGKCDSYKTIAYCGSLDKALQACRKDYTRNVIMSHEVLVLDDAISIIVRSNNHVASLIKNAFEGVET